MNMRETFVATTKEFIEKDPRIALVLGGISVASFNDIIARYPERVFDAGIMEQTDISVAAGMAVTGMIPIFHTIAPFLAERAYEQLKIDFGYQKLGGNFVSNGASIDYSSFGATHQCPGEIGILKQIPGMQIIVAGTPTEFDKLYRSCIANGCPTYYRLSRDCNSFDNDVEFGKANVIKKGSRATVIAVGPMLKTVLQAVEDLDVTVLYYTTVEPFDSETLKQNCVSGKIVLCEPYYEGALLYDIYRSMAGRAISVKCCGMPHEFCSHYGSTKQNMDYWELNSESIRRKVIHFYS